MNRAKKRVEDGMNGKRTKGDLRRVSSEEEEDDEQKVNGKSTPAKFRQ